MDISIEIAVGSSLQIALFVIPISVLISLFISPSPMSIIFKPIELFLFGASVLIANQVVKAGKTNWMEGLKLMSVYVIAAVGFYIIG
jgi:Ca2+:H+ antiporter